MRRTIALGVVVLTSGGLLALEHTSTGATTGTPSHVHTSSTTSTTKKPITPIHDCKHGNSWTYDDHNKSTSDDKSTYDKKSTHDDDDDDQCRPPSGGRGW